MLGRSKKEINNETGEVAVKKKPQKQKYYWDYSLMLTVIFLLCFGLVMIYSTSYYSPSGNSDGQYDYLIRQGFFSAIGIIIMFLIPRLIDYRLLINKTAWVAQAIGFACMLAVYFTPLGIEVNGSKRWLGFGFASFQPTELIKLATILFLVKYLTDMKSVRNNRGKFVAFFALLLIPTALVGYNNLSSGIILVCIILVLYYVSAKKLKFFWMMIAAIIALVVIAVFFGEVLVDLHILKEYQYSRVRVWKDPSAYAQEGGYQVLQGLYAIGSGGLFGKGLGNSTQKLGYVPEARNDMIFSIICEEFGVFGALCLMALFVFMLYRMMIIVRNARDKAGKYLVIGVMTHIAIQLILNIAVVTNSMPNTGVSLPFISYGGSSVLFLLAEMGLVFSVGRDIPIKSKKAEKE